MKNSKKISLKLIYFVMLLLVLSACGGGGGSSSSSSNVEEKQNPGNITWGSDILEAINVNRWSLDEDSGDLIFSGAGTGKLQWLRLSSNVYNNPVLQFEYLKEQGNVEGLVAVIFRADQDLSVDWFPANGYYMGTDQQAYYAVFRMDVKKAALLNPWSLDGRLPAGLNTWQKLNVDADGSILKFYVNDNLVSTITDGIYPSGYVYLGVYDDAGDTKVRIRNLSLQEKGAVANQPPLLSITSPSDNETVSGVVNILANASDSDGSIVKVEFYVNDVLNSTDTLSPYGYSWNTAALTNGSYTLKVVATDNQSAQTSITRLVQVLNAVPNQSPVVSITAPSNGASVSGVTSITASASDSDGTVSKVEFYVGGVLKKTDTSAPYNYIWDTSAVGNGSVSLKAIATDDDGAATENLISVTVNNVIPNQSPVVSITAPSNGASVSGVISIAASASDSDGTVSKVDFYINNILFYSDSSLPYGVSWDTGLVANGSYSLKAIATDDDGSATETLINVTVNNVIPNQSPVVSITAPSNGASVSGVTSIAASASDSDGTVSKVEFYVGGILKSTDTSAPYSYSWDSTTVSNGAVSLKVVATDDDGATAESTIEIVVLNTTLVSFDNILGDDGYIKALTDGSMPMVGLMSDLAVGRGGDGMINRTILSFDTTSLPDNAVITKVYLQVTYASSAGNPWASSNSLLIDVKNGVFGTAGTEASDWAAIADAEGVAQISEFTSGTKNSSEFSAEGLGNINKTGKTQLKLRFQNIQSSISNYLFIKPGTDAKLYVEYQ